MDAVSMRRRAAADDGARARIRRGTRLLVDHRDARRLAIPEDAVKKRSRFVDRDPSLNYHNLLGTKRIS
jgi:hypothetical protein